MRRTKAVWLCLLPLLLAAGAAVADAPEERDIALLSFDPSRETLSATVRGTLSVVYDGSGVSAGLRGFHLEIAYDDDYVFVDSLDVHVVEGDFLSNVGGTAFYVLPVDDSTFAVDCAILGATGGATGTGELCSITFKGRPAMDGASPVEIADVRLRDPDNNGLSYSAAFGVLVLDNTPPDPPTIFPEPEFTQGLTNYVAWSDESASGAVGYCCEASETPDFAVISGSSGCTPYTEFTFSYLNDGQIYYYRVKCRDDVWNTSDWSVVEHSTQDDSAPETEAGPLDPYYNVVTFDVPFAAFDATSGVDNVELFYRRDGGVYVQYGGTFTTSPIAFVAPGDGVYDFYTIGTDNVGNVEEAPGSPDCSTEVDLTGPAPPIDLVALPGHNSISLTWTVPVARDAPVEGTLIVRRPWSFSAYPEYDDQGPPFGYPPAPTGGIAVAFVPGTGAQSYEDTGFTDASRNVHYYTAFTRDLAGNYSVAALTAQDRSTSYWLADVREPTGTPGTYDGFVDYYDKVAYSYSYYSTAGDFNYDAELDVGPTDDNSRMGIPLTDNVIDFEDLMILAMNYGRVFPTGITEEAVTGATFADATRLLLRHEQGQASEGELVTVAVAIEQEEPVTKGLSALISFDPAALELVCSGPGALLDASGESFFFCREVSPGLVRIDAAILGAEAVLAGSGSAGVLTFRVVSAEPGRLRFEEAALRNARNRDVFCETSGLSFDSDDALPRESVLLQNAPNPFNPRTIIAYDLFESGHVLLEVYRVDGRAVATLVDGFREAGAHAEEWDGRDARGHDAGSGVYFCVLKSEGQRLTRKMVLMR